MIHVVLFQPEIPHNTGAIGRLVLGAGARLHLIRPFGFSLEDKHLKRAGLDYWEEVDVHVWDDWASFRSGTGADRLWMLSTKGQGCYWEAPLAAGEDVWLVLGPETRGLPESMLAESGAEVLRIPMHGTRSLNLATAAGIVLYEAVRQRQVAGMDPPLR